MDMDHKNLKKLGVNLRLMRRKRGLTQEKLAEIAQIHPVYVSYIEKGYRNPSITKIIRVAIALQCRPIDIFRGIF
jgi:transcriptional regulator with XRE-family HTH domain